MSLGLDLSINWATTAWRRGFSNETVIQVGNIGTQQASNTVVTLVFPQEAYVLQSDLSFASPNEKSFVWNLGTIKPGEKKTIQIIDSIGLEATTGQMLHVNANVEANGTDLNLSNNSFAEEVEVVGALDPNDMLVSPKGDGPQGFISKEQWLTYTIRFENIGTYKATYVFLENSLPSGLDVSTFEVISSSHQFSYTINPQRMLMVSFLHINLPTATEDSVGAHGYFKYKIRPQKSIQGGSSIENNAKIFFDFESPIETNNVLNTIKSDGSNDIKSLKTRPNPADQHVLLILDEESYKVSEPKVVVNWKIINETGTLIKQGAGNFESIQEIDISMIQSGFYILKVIDQLGDLYIGKIVKN